MKNFKDKIGAVLFISVFIFAGVYILRFFAIDTHMDCSRSLSSCSITTSNIFGEKKERIKFPLSRLKNSEMEETKCGKRYSNICRRAVLVLNDNKKIPIQERYSSDSINASRQSRRIVEFLENKNQAEVSVTLGDRFLKTFGLIFTIMGLVILATILFGNSEPKIPSSPNYK